ncbi:MAG TPA: hypothetical protein VHD83_01065, partial [Puia sp.]|nr:hypothetical protein [Puia sp.]
MPGPKLLGLLFFLTLTKVLQAGPDRGRTGPGKEGTYTRTPDGVIVYPDMHWSGNTAAVKLSVVAENIIRVLSSPVKGEADRKSLITVYKVDPSVKWDMTHDEEKVVLHTRLLTATVIIATGAVHFTDAAGQPILAEKGSGGRSFDAAVFDGAPSYHIRQTFAATPDEAFYGLGQHQDGLVNYKGHQVSLFQNNTEVAIPFLLSSRNYGILWDNYSLTTVGDIRPYKQLSALRLYSAHGEQGWLTAYYHNDKLHPEVVALEKAESLI